MTLMLIGSIGWLVVSSIVTNQIVQTSSSVEQESWRNTVLTLCWIMCLFYTVSLIARIFERGGQARLIDLDDIEARNPSKHSHREEEEKVFIGWGGRKYTRPSGHHISINPTARDYSYGLIDDGNDPDDLIFVPSFRWQCISFVQRLGIRWKTMVNLVEDAPFGFPKPLDQGRLNSCSANAVSNLLLYMLKRRAYKTGREYEKLPQPSRLFIYYNTRVRVMKESSNDDCGASLRAVCKASSKYHFCPEGKWPYDDRKFVGKFSVQPDNQAYHSAQKVKLTYVKIPKVEFYVLAALEEGRPILAGIKLYARPSQWMQRFHYLPPPLRYEVQNESYNAHAILICGYDLKNRVFLAQNSWGEKWGNNGFFYLHFDYIFSKKLGRDLWTFKSVRAGSSGGGGI